MLECHFGSSRIETTHQAHQKYYIFEHQLVTLIQPRPVLFGNGGLASVPFSIGPAIASRKSYHWELWFAEPGPTLYNLDRNDNI